MEWDTGQKQVTPPTYPPHPHSSSVRSGNLNSLSIPVGKGSEKNKATNQRKQQNNPGQRLEPGPVTLACNA